MDELEVKKSRRKVTKKMNEQKRNGRKALQSWQPAKRNFDMVTLKRT